MRTTMMEPEDNQPMVGKAVWIHISIAIKHATEISKCENVLFNNYFQLNESHDE